MKRHAGNRGLGVGDGAARVIGIDIDPPASGVLTSTFYTISC
jgi:hypothetical protein